MACGVLKMSHKYACPLVHIEALPQAYYRHGCRRWLERRVQANCNSRSKVWQVHGMVWSCSSLFKVGGSVQQPPLF